MQQCNSSKFSCRTPCFLYDTNEQHLPNLIPSEKPAESVVATGVILELNCKLCQPISIIRRAESASTGSVATSVGTAVAFSNEDADPNKKAVSANGPSLRTPI